MIGPNVHDPVHDPEFSGSNKTIILKDLSCSVGAMNNPKGLIVAF